MGGKSLKAKKTGPFEGRGEGRSSIKSGKTKKNLGPVKRNQEGK